MLVTTYGIGFANHNGQVVSVQLHKSRGARFHVSGISWSEARKILSRIFAAFEHTGYARPTGAFTLLVSPTDKLERMATLDVPIALAFLAAMGEIPAEAIREVISMGEMELDGSIRPFESPWALLNPEPHQMPSVNRMCLLPAGTGSSCYVDLHPRSIHLAANLTSIARHFQQGAPLPMIRTKKPWRCRLKWEPQAPSIFESLELSEIQRKTLLVAAAGNLSLMMIGSPGTGKSQMARAVHELLPILDESASAQLQSFHRMRGEPYALQEVPPFRSPHHRSSSNGLVGSWRRDKAWMPGELSLAEGGVLCLDEFTEFSRDCIESLRGPMEFGTLSISRAHGGQTVAVSALIIATSNPCPCGHFHEGGNRCSCTSGRVQNYLKRISGPVMERFTLHLETQNQSLIGPLSEISLSTARECTKRCRLALQSKSSWSWSAEAIDTLQRHVRLHRVSPRGRQKIETIATVHALVEHFFAKRAESKGDAAIKISPSDVRFAGQMRIFDRPNWWSFDQSRSSIELNNA